MEAQHDEHGGVGEEVPSDSSGEHHLVDLGLNLDHHPSLRIDNSGGEIVAATKVGVDALVNLFRISVNLLLNLFKVTAHPV